VIDAASAADVARRCAHDRRAREERFRAYATFGRAQAMGIASALRRSSARLGPRAMWEAPRASAHMSAGAHINLDH
jgi:hypothetical protein